MGAYNLVSPNEQAVYARSYTVNPLLTGGHSVTIHTECSESGEPANGRNHYYLEIFMSADNYGARKFLVGVLFGAGSMNKREVDAQIDWFVNGQVGQECFSEDVREYLENFGD